jgi:hypothetical protein
MNKRLHRYWLALFFLVAICFAFLYGWLYNRSSQCDVDAGVAVLASSERWVCYQSIACFNTKCLGSGGYGDFIIKSNIQGASIPDGTYHFNSVKIDGEGSETRMPLCSYVSNKDVVMVTAVAQGKFNKKYAQRLSVNPNMHLITNNDADASPKTYVICGYPEKDSLTNKSADCYFPAPGAERGK